MEKQRSKVEYSKKQVGGVTIGLFILQMCAIVQISFAGLEQFQSDSVVSIIQGVTTLTGVAITNYSVKAGVENTSKIKNSYQEAKSMLRNDTENTTVVEDSIG